MHRKISMKSDRMLNFYLLENYNIILNSLTTYYLLNFAISFKVLRKIVLSICFMISLNFMNELTKKIS